jgi:hypothetical protein
MLTAFTDSLAFIRIGGGRGGGFFLVLVLLLFVGFAVWTLVRPSQPVPPKQ